MTSIPTKIIHDKAEIPSQAHESDAGYDLTIAHWIKTITIGAKEFHYFGTGLQLTNTPDEYYFEIHERSSTHKKGWSLANKTGIIDTGYQGEIIVVLENILGVSNPHPIGQKLVQLIPRVKAPKIDFEVKHVDINYSVSSRADGGFGSTD